MRLDLLRGVQGYRRSAQLPPDFPSSEIAAGLAASLLSRSDVYSVVAEFDGRVVGSNFLWENGTIAGVGPITIDPSAQNAAFGRRLMEEVLRRAEERNIAGVRLVQASISCLQVNYAVSGVL